jgi:transcriptional regulator with XRE-family HTH domain
MSKEAVKSENHTAPDPPAPRLPDLSARIRARRSQLGLTGADLAGRAGISPSYVSLIEKGVKVPDEEVAAKLARALEDDEGLFRAWTRAARLGLENLDLLNRLEAASRTPAYVSLVESGHALPKLADSDAAEDLAARMREVAGSLSSPPDAAHAPGGSPSVASIPVLADGADPSVLDAAAPGAGVVDRLLLDRRLLGPLRTGLFACDVTPRAMKHLRGVAQPGDRIVFERTARVAPDRICAVRHGTGLLLSRVLTNGRSLLLLPGEGESGFESIEMADEKAVCDLVAGTQVLLIRR